MTEHLQIKRTTVQGDGTAFVPNGGSRRDTAIILVGTARDHGIDQRSIRAVQGGFYVSEDLAEVLFNEEALEEETENPDDSESGLDFDPSEMNIPEVKDLVTGENVETVLSVEQEGKNRPSLIEWLEQYIQETSGDRAAKNNAEEEE